MRKKADSKQAKANKVLRASAVAACPVPELRRLPKGVMRYYETVLHRQRAPRV